MTPDELLALAQECLSACRDDEPSADAAGPPAAADPDPQALLALARAASRPGAVPEPLREALRRSASARAARLLGQAQETDANPRITDQAVAVAAIAAALAEQSTRFVTRMNLAAALGLRSSRRGERTDLETSIVLLRGLVDDPPLAADPARDASLSNNLAKSLRARYEITGALEDLREAADGFAAAVAGAPDAASRSRYAGNAADTALAVFESTGSRAHLDAAVDAGRHALEGPETPDGYIRFSSLGSALRTRGEFLGSVEDVDEAVALHRRALDVMGPEQPARHAVLMNLGNSLRSRFEMTNESGDLDEAVRTTLTAIDSAPSRLPSLARYHANLGAMLRVRFELSTDPADLSEAVRHQQDAVTLASAHDPHLGRYASNLSGILLTRFANAGDPADLDDAVAAGRRAAAAGSRSPLEHARCLASLGGALLTRFELRDRLDDVSEATTVLRRAVGAVPAGHVDRATYLANLALIHQARFERTEDRRDLDAAVESAQAALAATAASSAARPARLTTLGSMLLTRFRLAADPADLEAAVDDAEAALAATTPSAGALPGRLSNAAMARLMRFQTVREQPDADRSIALAAAAVDGSPPESPTHGRSLINYGSVLMNLDEADGGDLSAAREALRKAADARTLPASQRIIAGEMWARAASRSGAREEAADAYAAAVDLLDVLIWRGNERSDAETALGAWAGLARDATAAAIAAGRAEQALQVSEAGRGVLWARDVSARTSLESLQEVDATLAAELAQIRRALDDESSDATPDENERTIAGKAYSAKTRRRWRSPR
jgi:tetratricopeptide (TPR) repeat protein